MRTPVLSTLDITTQRKIGVEGKRAHSLFFGNSGAITSDQVALSFADGEESDKAFLNRVDRRLDEENVETTRWYYKAQVLGKEEKTWLYNSAFRLAEKLGWKPLTRLFKKEESLKEIHQRYKDVVNLDTLKRLIRIHQQEGHPQGDDARRLALHLFREYIEGQQADTVQAFSAKQAELTIQIDGEEKPVSLQNALRQISVTESREKRAELYQKTLEAFNQHLAPLKQQLLNRELSVIKELGYTDPVQFYSEMYGHPLKEISAEFSELIQKTDGLYQKYVAPYFYKAVGVSLSDGALHDNQYLSGAGNRVFKSLTEMMPNDRLKDSMWNTLEVMGLNELVTEFNPKDIKGFRKHIRKMNSKKTRVYWDWAPRDKKRSRGIAFVAKSPNEIYSIMTLDKNSTVDTWRTSLHELLGHSLHYSHINPTLSFGDKLLGSWAVSETYAMLFESLLSNPHWLKNMAGLEDDKSVHRVQEFMALRDLRVSRLCHSKLKLDLATYDLAKDNGMELNARSLNQMDENYSSTMKLVWGYSGQHSGQGIRSKDNNVYSVNYVIAYMMASHLLRYLEDNYGGNAWYQDKQAIQFMKSLWEKGSPKPEVIADAIGLPHDKITDPSALIYRLNRRLKTD